MGVVIVPRFLPVMSVATSASSDLSLSIKEACSSKSPRNSIGGSYLECKVVGFFQTQATSPGLRHLHALKPIKERVVQSRSSVGGSHYF